MKTSFVYLILALVVLTGACSSGGTDPMAAGIGGSSLSGQNLANETVSESTRLEMYMMLLDQLYAAYNKGLNTAASYNFPDDPVTVLGNYTGRATVSPGVPEDTTSAPEDTASAGDDSTSTTVPDDPYYDIDTTDTHRIPFLSIRFSDFSNTGRLFFTGTFEFKGYWRVAIDDTGLDSLIIDGSADFAGDYTGSIEFYNVHAGLDSTGQLVDLVRRANAPQGNLKYIGLVTIRSGDNTIMFNPNTVDIP